VENFLYDGEGEKGSNKRTSVLVSFWPHTIWAGMGVNPGLDCERLALIHVVYGKGFGRLQYKSLLHTNSQNFVAVGLFSRKSF
jgi:hypothetical protein